MKWKGTTEECYLEREIAKEKILVAHIKWIGNIYLCNAFPPNQPNQTTTEATLEQAQKWAEERLK